MNRLKKTTFVVLGIVAAVGLASLIVSPNRPVRPVCNIESEALPLLNDPADVLASAEKSEEPVSPSLEDSWFWTVKCDICGKDYKKPKGCTFTTTPEEEEHFHTTPEQRAQQRALGVKLLDEAVAAYERARDEDPEHDVDVVSNLLKIGTEQLDTSEGRR